MTETPSEKPAQPKTTPGVDDDPRLIAAKLDYELAKVALEKERLNLTDQSEKAKLFKELVPDFGATEVKEDATTTSDKPSALSDCLIQRVIYNVIDDIGDTMMQAVNKLASNSQSPASPWTFWVTSDTSHIDHAAAYRDVSARLIRLQAAIDRACPAQEDGSRDEGQVGRMALDPVSAALAALGAVPGAITMATRLLANQYTASAYTSVSAGSVDLHAAGAIASRITAVSGTTVRVRRLHPARDSGLEEGVLDFAKALDGRLSDARSRARITSATAASELNRLETRRTQLARRADDMLSAWKDKVGKSAASAGLAEDLALVKALEAAIAAGDPESDETKRNIKTLEAVKKRIDSVLEALETGESEMGTQALLAMVQALDEEAQTLADREASANDQKSQADQTVGQLDSIHAASIDFLDSLGSANGSSERLWDKALLGAALADPATLICYVRILNAGADGMDVTRAVRDDLRILVYGATVEWAVTRVDGTVLDAGARTQIGYQKADLADPEKATSGVIVGAAKPRQELLANN